jgi:ribonuclease HI
VVAFRPTIIFFRLEDVGPTFKHTSNRAELRTAIAALGIPCIQIEGLEFWAPKEAAELIIATDSSYVVNGATSG